MKLLFADAGNKYTLLPPSLIKAAQGLAPPVDGVGPAAACAAGGQGDAQQRAGDQVKQWCQYVHRFLLFGSRGMRNRPGMTGRHFETEPSQAEAHRG